MPDFSRPRSGPQPNRYGRIPRLVQGLLVAALALALAACGVPGVPLPPLLDIPQPASDLVAEQVGARVLLRFSVPRLTTEGTLIRSLDRIEIRGAFLPGNTATQTFPAEERLLATLPAAQIPDGVAQLTYALPLEASQRGTRAVFALKAVNHREMDDGFSNLASLEIADLPGPPADLQATLTERAIELRWTAAGGSAFGGVAPEPEGYEVYRTEAGSLDSPELLAISADPFYDDRTFAFGNRYIYTVRAFATRGDSTARTPESNRAEISAVDRFPPAAPQNLRGIAVAGAVELAWSANAEEDLAGYNLYRSEGGQFIRLNSNLLTLPLYRDAAVIAGIEYRYEVKAVDRTGNEGAPSPEAVARAEFEMQP